MTPPTLCVQIQRKVCWSFFFLVSLFPHVSDGSALPVLVIALCLSVSVLCLLSLPSLSENEGGINFFFDCSFFFKWLIGHSLGGRTHVRACPGCVRRVLFVCVFHDSSTGLLCESPVRYRLSTFLPRLMFWVSLLRCRLAHECFFLFACLHHLFLTCVSPVAWLCHTPSVPPQPTSSLVTCRSASP